MPTSGYRSGDRYQSGRQGVRERGVEVILGVVAGLLASAVLGIMLLSGVSRSDPARDAGPLAAATPASSGLATFALPSQGAPSGSPAFPSASPGTAGSAGATAPPNVGAATNPPPGAAGQPPAPLPTPRPTPRPVEPPPPATEPPPPPTEPPPPATEPPPPATEPPPSPTTSGPKRAVRDFYAAVEDHLWQKAIALWSPSMQERYPPQEWLIDRFTPTTRIDITYIETVERGDGRARVEVALVEYRLIEPSPRTFVGAWDLVKIDGVWLLDVPYF